uniref:Tudor domain-containing protein n=1 Tax=Haemonchus contortus TaxID=6289 RepID=A0A7I5E609_HAECO
MSFVYRKDESVENEDVWDDTELIKMYEHSVSATYCKLGAAATSNCWSVGDSCLARYSEDDLYYPAKIEEIREEKPDQPGYLVRYEGYGNTDWVSADDIVPATSDDGSQEDGNVNMDSAPENTPVKRHAVKTSKSKKGRTSRKESSTSGRLLADRPHPTIPSIAPPPPSVLAGLSVPDEAEALSSMLMSWYMSGYHTGYYQAVKDLNSKK